MTSETTLKQGSDDAGGTGADGALFALYRRYVGEPESRRNVYVGFGAFFAGLALGLVGLVLFLYSAAQPTGSDFFWLLREVALVFALLALPAVAMSVVVLLPVGRRTVAASLAGATLCVAAAAWLTQVYPYEWTAAGNDISVVTTYSAGLVLLAASTGSALVAQYVDRATARGGEATAEPTAGDNGDDDVSDEQVAADIEDAMSESTLTWGGVERSATTERLKLDMPDPEAEIDGSHVEPATETRSSGDDVDDAVAGLRQLQGGERETARAESPDAQVDALTEFRRETERDDDLDTGVETDRGLFARLRGLFG